MNNVTKRKIINKNTEPNSIERLLEMKYYAKRQIIHNNNFYKGQEFLKEANKQPKKTVKYCDDQINKRRNNETKHKS